MWYAARPLITLGKYPKIGYTAAKRNQENHGKAQIPSFRRSTPRRRDDRMDYACTVRDILMAANIALVIVAEMVCFFGGTFIAGALAGFAAGFFGAPHLMALTGLLAIPSLISLGHFAGRWIARHQPRPTSTEIMIGCVVYTSVSTVLVGFAHPAAAAVAMIANAATSFILYRSAHRTGLAAATLKEA